MKIWLINQYNMPPEYGHLNRHYYFGKHLHQMGHEPTVFVGSFLHNTTVQVIEDNKRLEKFKGNGFPYYFVKTCNYGNSKIRRVWAMVEFYRNVTRGVKNFDKPDAIVGSSAHPLAALAAIRLARKYRCKAIVEVRDLWPESIVAYGFLKGHNPFVKWLRKGEKWLYAKCDELIFTMEGGKDYILDQGWAKEQGGSISMSKVHHVNNGIDLETFSYNKDHYVMDDEDLKNENTFKVVYTGSIRKVNDVQKIVKVAEILKKRGDDRIRFLIYGDGPDRKNLEAYCKKHKVDNLVFKGHVEKKYIPFILSHSNVNILHFQNNKLKRYGASLNKMFDYFASGKPTISDCLFGYDIIEKFQCGQVLDNATSDQLADAIEAFYKMKPETYQKYCSNALCAAEEYEFGNLTKKLIEICS